MQTVIPFVLKNATDWATITCAAMYSKFTLMRMQLHGVGANVAFYNNNAEAKNYFKWERSSEIKSH